MSKILLKLEEANELKFKVNIQGTTSEPTTGKPIIRLLVSEKENPNGMSFVFHSNSISGDLVTFVIPTLDKVFMSDVVYIGKIEVIIGTRIFCPSSIEIQFINDLKVEIVPVYENNDSGLVEEEQIDVTSMLSEIENKTPEIHSVGSNTKTDGKKKITLTKSQLQEMIALRRAEKANAKKTSPLKEEMKEMMKSALTED